MVELANHPSCVLCHAKVFLDNKYVCVPSKLDGIRYKQPTLCPLPRIKGETTSNVQNLLRKKLGK